MAIVHQSPTRTDASGAPFRPGSASLVENAASEAPVSAAVLLSRIRAGSNPSRTSLLSANTPFGPTVFSTSYNRGRASTLSGLLPDSPSSPPALEYRKDSLVDADIRTLDYLGLVDPSPASAPVTNAGFGAPSTQDMGRRPLMASQRLPSNRFRSYSVNAKEKYQQEEEDEMDDGAYYSGMLTPSAEAAAQALAITQAQIRQHNIDVQAFAHAAAVNRPRARTAGLLDSPSSRLWRGYTPSQVEIQDEEEDVSGGIEADDLQAQIQELALLNLAAQAQAVATPGGRMVYDDATRALWLGNIPPSTTTSSLKAIFEAFGKIESARVLTHKSCGFVNFERVESALQAKSELDGKEIFPGAGLVRIGFAKVQSTVGTPTAEGYFPSPSPALPLGRSVMVAPNNGLEITKPLSGLNDDMVPPPVASIRESKDEILNIVKILGATEEEIARISMTVDQALQHDHYESEIPPVPESGSGRIHDAPKLRDIRKRIDNTTPQEIEDIAMAMLPEIAELASDYLGNTVVQKLFDFCSEPMKELMLAELQPYLAEIGVHKNGTWAAQKVIDVAHTPKQMSMIVDGLRPYGIACFLDQYGNYVMQCCLKFDAPFNDFLFDVMLTRLTEVSGGRFGARAMRACLESHHATKDQQRMLAAVIALNSVQLATNTNGALLLTWYLDTCTFPGRRQVLVPLLIPHLIELCTHKVAYLTILKIINQRNEPGARDALLDAIFTTPEDSVLTEILKDQACGATLIFKVLTTPFFEESKRAKAIETIRTVLLELKVPASQGYKRLLDEVGLSSRAPAGPAVPGGTPAGATDGPSRPTSKAGQPHAGEVPAQQNNGYFPNMPSAPYASNNSNGYPLSGPGNQYDPFTTGRSNGQGQYHNQQQHQQHHQYQRGPPPPMFGVMGYPQTTHNDAYRALLGQRPYQPGMHMPPQQQQMGMPYGMGQQGQNLGFDPALLHRWAEAQGYAMGPPQGRGRY